MTAGDSEIAPDAIRLGGRNAIRHLYTGNYDDMVPAHRQAQGDYSRDLERLASLNRSDPLRIRQVVNGGEVSTHTTMACTLPI